MQGAPRCASLPRPLAVALLAAAFALSLGAPRTQAASLSDGAVVLLDREDTATPGVLLHLDVAAGVFDAIAPQPALVTPRDLVVRHDGTILVADAALGLVGVAPGSGTATVLAGPAAFGGAGPTTLAFALKWAAKAPLIAEAEAREAHRSLKKQQGRELARAAVAEIGKSAPTRIVPPAHVFTLPCGVGIGDDDA